MTAPGRYTAPAHALARHRQQPHMLGDIAGTSDCELRIESAIQDHQPMEVLVDDL